jgi:hypothetical protein
MRWLVAGAGVVALLAAGCSSGATGTVTGTFQEETGPSLPNGQAANGPWALSGTVRFTGANGEHVDVAVAAGSAGKFSARRAPGTYTVTGLTAEMSPVDPNSGLPSQSPCEMQNMGTTRVRAGQTDRITLTCIGP